MCDLGSPIRSFWKEDVRDLCSSIPQHARAYLPGRRTECQSMPRRRRAIRLSLVGPSLLSICIYTNPLPPANPYFISHPHLGLTFLLHPTSHTLLKIILHSNLPGEVNFGRCSRCSWEIVTHTSERRGSAHPFSSISDLLNSTTPPSGHHLAVHSNSGGRSESVGSVDSNRSGSGSTKSGGGKSRRNHDPSPVSGLREQAVLGPEPERPMILDRTVEGRDGYGGGKKSGKYSHSIWLCFPVVANFSRRDSWLSRDRARGDGVWRRRDRLAFLKTYWTLTCKAVCVKHRLLTTLEPLDAVRPPGDCKVLRGGLEGRVASPHSASPYRSSPPPWTRTACISGLMPFLSYPPPSSRLRWTTPVFAPPRRRFVVRRLPRVRRPRKDTESAAVCSFPTSYRPTTSLPPTLSTCQSALLPQGRLPAVSGTLTSESPPRLA